MLGLWRLVQLRYFLVLLMPCSWKRAESIRLVHYSLSILWALLARTRHIQFWDKFHNCWNSIDNTFFQDPVKGWNSDYILYVFASPGSTWLCGGETYRAERRSGEYVSRILQGPGGLAAQPFFDLIHFGSSVHKLIAWRLSHWTLVPVARAAAEKSSRLLEEHHMINTMQMQLAKLLGVAFENVRVSKACSFGKTHSRLDPAAALSDSVNLATAIYLECTFNYALHHGIYTQIVPLQASLHTPQSVHCLGLKGSTLGHFLPLSTTRAFSVGSPCLRLGCSGTCTPVGRSSRISTDATPWPATPKPRRSPARIAPRPRCMCLSQPR